MSPSPIIFPALADLPLPSIRRIALRVSRSAERALAQGHPWVFEQSIQQQSHAGQPGDLAVIFDHKRKFIGIGLYDPHSTIRVRVLQHHHPITIDQAFYTGKLVAAGNLRKPLEELPTETATTGYRLVHGENDGLPGLVIDRYHQTLVIKLYSNAWLPHLVDVLSALIQVVPVERLVLRLSRSLLEKPSSLFNLSDGMVLSGPSLDRPVIFSENGLRFEADVLRGHKTGFFFDQRDNRVRVEKLSHNKTVLDVFAYTGGFSVYAARGGAQKITSIDTSQPALETAARNMSHNRVFPTVAAAQHEQIAGDGFEMLSQMATKGRRFEVVILDPPAFTQTRDKIPQAISAYQRLTQLGLSVLQPGGMLVQASCSSQVTAGDFFEAVHTAARLAGRLLTEIDRSGHPIDHPIRFKEGAYLKCLFATA